MQLRWLIISVVVVILDQLSRRVSAILLDPDNSSPLLEALFNTLNQGVGLGVSVVHDISSWDSLVLLAIATVTCAMLIHWLLRLRRSDTIRAIGLTLAIGGIVSDAINRFLFGHVAIYLALQLNLADVAVLAGFVLLLARFFITATTRGGDRSSCGRRRDSASPSGG